MSPPAGIQFWNGSRDKGFERGRTWWIQELEQVIVYFLWWQRCSRRFERYHRSIHPLMKLSHSRKHIFGNVRTIVEYQVPTAKPSPTRASWKPFVVTISISATARTRWERNYKMITFRAQSNKDMGTLKKIRIFGQRHGDAHEKEILSPDFIISENTGRTISLILLQRNNSLMSALNVKQRSKNLH
jgi:hypothetical protein